MFVMVTSLIVVKSTLISEWQIPHEVQHYVTEVLASTTHKKYCGLSDHNESIETEHVEAYSSCLRLQKNLGGRGKNFIPLEKA